jgi:hypothetical protein
VSSKVASSIVIPLNVLSMCFFKSSTDCCDTPAYVEISLNCYKAPNSALLSVKAFFASLAFFFVFGLLTLSLYYNSFSVLNAAPD